jgi:hypothetical protein
MRGWGRTVVAGLWSFIDRVRALPAGWRDAVLATLVAVLSFTPG